MKSRRLTPRNLVAPAHAILVSSCPDPFHGLVGILFTEDFIGPACCPRAGGCGGAAGASGEYVNARRLILRDSVWAMRGVEDITDRIRDAAEAAPLPPPAPEERHRASAASLAQSIVCRSGRSTAVDAEGRPARGPGRTSLCSSTGLSRRELGEVVGTGGRGDRDGPEPERRPLEHRTFRAGSSPYRGAPGPAWLRGPKRRPGVWAEGFARWLILTAAIRASEARRDAVVPE